MKYYKRPRAAGLSYKNAQQLLNQLCGRRRMMTGDVCNTWSKA